MKDDIEIKNILKKLEKFNDDNFSFDPEPHIYKYKNEEFIGCTTYLKNFKYTFDVEAKSAAYAKKHGLLQEDVKKLWDDKRIAGCDLGTIVHDWIENFYKDRDKYLVNGKIELKKEHYTDVDEANSRIDKFVKIYNEHLYKFIPIASEVRMFHKKWKISGTFDQLYYYNGQIIIADWKTNIKFNDDSAFAFNMLKYPFQSYKENELNIYSIQISIYRLMLESVGIKCAYGFICHIPGKGEAQIYKLKDFRPVLKKYLNGRRINDNVVEKKLW